jgi:hypothetical protein
MIRGFEIDRSPYGTGFGVCNFAANVEDRHIIEAIATQARCPVSAVTLCCAHELIDEMYEGIAFLTTEA